VCLQRQQKAEARKAYRNTVMALENSGQHSSALPKQKKAVKDGGVSVSMLTVEEVRYKFILFEIVNGYWLQRADERLGNIPTE